jgi:hypothetical protein
MEGTMKDQYAEAAATAGKRGSVTFVFSRESNSIAQYNYFFKKQKKHLFVFPVLVSPQNETVIVFILLVYNCIIKRADTGPVQEIFFEHSPGKEEFHIVTVTQNYFLSLAFIKEENSWR